MLKFVYHIGMDIFSVLPKNMSQICYCIHISSFDLRGYEFIFIQISIRALQLRSKFLFLESNVENEYDRELVFLEKLGIAIVNFAVLACNQRSPK